MVIEAIRQARLHNLSFRDIFRFQYVVSAKKLDIPDMKFDRIGDHFVHFGVDLPIERIHDRNGEKVGVLIGVAADHKGKKPARVISRKLSQNDSRGFKWFESYLPIVAGRYAIVLNLAGESRYYCDATGMIGAVYAPETHRIASSPLLTIDREIIPNPLFDLTKVEKGSHGYGLSHTQDAHVHRLNANHYFDLNEFTHQRFWPKASDEFRARPEDYGQIVDEIVGSSRNIMTSLAKRFPAVLPLSGGFDSRLLFALAGKTGREALKFCYSHINTFANRRDATIGAALCDLASVPFEIHDRKYLKPAEEEIRKNVKRWHVAAGTPAPAPLEVQNGLCELLPNDAVVFRGHQTNIMRAQYFKPSSPGESVRPVWQYKVMNMATKDEDARNQLIRELKSLRGELPKKARAVIPDFVFYEMLVPAALGQLFQGLPNAFFMSPFNSRRLVQLSMSFDLEYKFSNKPTWDVLMRADPNAAKVAFGDYLQADLRLEDNSVQRRQAIINEALERYEVLHGETAPKVEALPFSNAAEQRIVAEMRATFEDVNSIFGEVEY